MTTLGINMTTNDQIIDWSAIKANRTVSQSITNHNEARPVWDLRDRVIDLRVSYGEAGFDTVSDMMLELGNVIVSLADAARAFEAGEYGEAMEALYEAAVQMGNANPLQAEDIQSLTDDLFVLANEKRTNLISTGRYPHRR